MAGDVVKGATALQDRSDKAERTCSFLFLWAVSFNCVSFFTKFSLYLQCVKQKDSLCRSWRVSVLAVGKAGLKWELPSSQSPRVCVPFGVSLLNLSVDGNRLKS